jgi:hypothetical protein
MKAVGFWLIQEIFIFSQCDPIFLAFFFIQLLNGTRIVTLFRNVIFVTLTL